MPASRLTILTYHRVLERPDPLRPDEFDVRAFGAHMRALARWFRVLPLTEAIERLHAHTLPRRAVAITFDDGYADNCEVALPVLVRHGLPAAFFIAAGFLDGGCMWNDAIIETIRRASGPALALDDVGGAGMPLDTWSQRLHAASTLIAKWKYLPLKERQRRVEALQRQVGVDPPGDLMMRTDQVRTLAAGGMEIGAHTVDHPILERLADADATFEITEGKRRLEQITGDSVTLFAYPNGRPGRDYNARHVAMVRAAGFRAAVSTRAASATAADDLFQLPRLAPWDRSAVRFVARLIRWRFEPVGKLATTGAPANESPPVV